MVNVLKLPPLIRLNRPNKPSSEFENAAASAALSIPGTGTADPNLKITIINNVKRILLLKSGIFQAFLSVDNN